MNQQAIRNPLSLTFAVEGFLLDQQTQNHTAATIAFYARYLRHFQWFLSQGGYPSTFRDITARTIREFFLYLQEPAPQGRWGTDTTVTRKALKPASIHAFYRTLSAFWSWMGREENIPNPMLNIPAPKLPSEWQVVTFSEEELGKILMACEQAESAELISRDKAIFMVLIDAGPRAGELLGIQLGDFDLAEGTIVVHGKGQKDRTIVIGYAARKALREYLKHRLAVEGSEQALWLSRDETPLTYNGLKELFNRLRERSGVAHCHAHICRHTAGTMLHRNKMRGEMIQKLLGHTRFDTTRRYYLDISTADLAGEHAEHGVLDRLSLRQTSPTSAGRIAAAKLPGDEKLRQEVSMLGYSAVGRKYGVSPTTIRRHLV